MMRIPILILLFIFSFTGFSYGQHSESKTLSPSLQKMVQGKKENELIDVLVAANDSAWLFKEKGIRVLSAYKNMALLRLTVKKFSQLVSGNKIIFAGQYRMPKEELTTGSFDLSLNKISLVHNKFPAITGDSVNASVKEQRFDTSDIDMKGRIFETGLAAPAQSTHASIMATLLAGAGNSSSFAKGVAFGSAISSSSFTSLLPDPDSVFNHYSISVQNHSYGTAIENYYGADAAAYDLSAVNNPSLVYVFSSGNSGSSASSGNYSNVQGYANLTGSFKMAKNILTVGATDSFNKIATLSSKGPVYDGRIGPHLVAFGEDGTSGAAALVSGAAVLLQHSYKLMHNDSLPSSSLIRAVLLNSADDVNAPHVDYTSGYGSLNAFEAIKTISDNRFLEDQVQLNETKNYSFHLPSGLTQVKFTLVWNDIPAPVNASHALVNDLDAQLLLPITGESWHPWVLNPIANKDSLLLPAQRKIDTLNTVEQITIDDPQQGDYELQIHGTKINGSAPQHFSIAYQLDSIGGFYWTYPSSSDVLTAASSNMLRWQTNIKGVADIQYSTDGITWNTIAADVDLGDQFVKWNVPDTVTTAWLRMNISGLCKNSDSFVISGPMMLDVGFNCPDSFLLYWNNINAHQYRLKQLGTKYMDPFLQLSDTFTVFNKATYPGLYYSVTPLIKGREGLGSFTINYTTQGIGCYVRTFYALLQNKSSALLSLELGTLHNVLEISFQKWNGTNFSVIQKISSPVSVTLSYTDNALVSGMNRYRVAIKLNSGQLIYSTIEIVNYFPSQPVIVFPDPSSENDPITLIVKDQGVYNIRIVDAMGRIIKLYELNDLMNYIPAFTLSKGLYFIQVNTMNAKVFVQKLIVY